MRGNKKLVSAKTAETKTKRPNKPKIRKAKTAKTLKKHYEYRIFTLDDYKQAWRYRKVPGVAEQAVDDLACAWERVRKGYCHRDLYDMHRWFLQTIPDMLDDFAASCMSAPSSFLQGGNGAAGAHMIAQKNSDNSNGKAPLDKWRQILSQMSEMLREADDNQSRVKNKCDDDYARCLENFKKKYGQSGEKLLTEEEKEDTVTNGRYRVAHLMDEVPEYREICCLHSEERQRLKEYRDRCKDDGLRMLARWLRELWT